MSRIRRVSSTSIGIAVFLGAVLLCQPARPSEILSANVRPFFAVGPSFPVDFDNVSRGFGMGFGFEVEQSPRVSVLFRVELNYMSGDLPNLYLNYPFTQTNELTTTNWSLGARTYLAKHGPVRSYVDGCLGVRLVGDALPGGGIGPSGGGGGSRGEPEGLAVTLRVGLSSAGTRRHGLFLDSGLDFLIDHPDRYGLVPVRLGIVFP